MEEYKGEWVILKGNTIIAHNKDMKKILELSEQYKDQDISISRSPSSMYCFY